MTRKKKATWPRCDGNLCEAKADISLHLAGDFGEVAGYYCYKHSDMLQEALSPKASWVILLWPLILKPEGSLFTIIEPNREPK